ncbi:Hexaprenyldihydroxybenzoate methyltransferase, mitochondrial [Tulasnella sp. 418]|nr:Hexaprenyldihydroxybenzoate methyltransferase, mitochondrial [Tulasnella sp. 418]
MRISRRLLSAASSVNPSEIAFFSQLSQHWWDEHGEFALLHRMNPVRVGYIRDKIIESARDDAETVEQGDRLVSQRGSKILDGMSVLDVGCGGGLLSEALARLGGRTTGIDASESNIKIASLHASQDPEFASQSSSSPQKLQYIHTSSEELLAKSNGAQYDVVCSMEVLEHVDSPSEFLRTLGDLVKPGGHLFLSTISRTPLAQLLTITMAEDILRLVSPKTHTYSKFVKPSELATFFREELKWIQGNPPSLGQGGPGYIPRQQGEFRGMAYIPWTGRWTIPPRGVPFELDCNYLFWARKPRSLASS